jgi:hypothetical protein
VAVLGLLAASLTACGDDGGSGPATELGELAAGGLAQEFSADYRLESGPPEDRTVSTVRVWRTADAFRLDVQTDAGTARYLSTADGVVSCQLPPGTTTADEKAGRTPSAGDDDAITCLTVAGPGATPPAAFDPSLQRLFGETLQAFADGDPELDVSDAVEDTVPVGTDVTCFLVAGTATDAGTYCLTQEGVPGKVTYASGTLALTSLNFMPPKAERFVPPVEPSPLPPGADTP